MKTELNKLKDELAPVYKDKARLTEELMQCRESLSRVRDINEKHSKALDEATSRIRDLQTRNKELSQQVDTERATQALAASELEVFHLHFLCTLKICLGGRCQSHIYRLDWSYPGCSQGIVCMTMILHILQVGLVSVAKCKFADSCKN